MTRKNRCKFDKRYVLRIVISHFIIALISTICIFAFSLPAKPASIVAEISNYIIVYLICLVLTFIGPIIGPINYFWDTKVLELGRCYYSFENWLIITLLATFILSIGVWAQFTKFSDTTKFIFWVVAILFWTFAGIMASMIEIHL